MMPDMNLTELVCIIGRPGSMESIRSDAVEGLNAFLERMKEVAGDANLTLTLFNHVQDRVHEGTRLKDVRPVTRNIYVTTGTNALLDAMGKTMEYVETRLRRENRSGKVIVVILTDGADSGSLDYTVKSVRRAVRERHEEYGWEFILVGTDQDVVGTAQSLSIPSDHAIHFPPTGEGIREAYSDLSRLVTSLIHRSGQ